MLLLGYPIVMDKQLTQYQLTPKMLWEYWNFQSQNVQIYGDVFQNINGRNHWDYIEDRVVPLGLYGHPLAGLLWERQFEKTHWWNLVGNKYQIGKAYSFIENKVILVGLCGWHQNGRKEAEFSSNVEEIDESRWYEETTSCLDHVYLGCTQHVCTPNEIIIEQYKEMFESRTSAGATEKLPGWGKPHAKTVSWSYDMEGHARKCVERYCELANKKTAQLYRVSSPCLDCDSFKWPKICSQNVLKCLCLARIGRPDILWSVNKLARSVIKRTHACDRRLARLISHIHHTCDYRQYCHVGNTAQHCRLGWFQDSDFAGDLEDSKSTSGEVLCIFGSRTFVYMSWMCKKQTSVSHSSTESEIIPLDAALRMDGSLALELWDVVIEVLRSTNSTKTPTHPAHGNRCETGKCSRDTPKTPTYIRRQNVDQWSRVDHIPTNTHSS